MKKIIMVLVTFILMAGVATAFTIPSKIEPLKWDGWVWGTKLKEVNESLSYAGKLSIPQINDPSAALYVRQGELNYYFGSGWDATYYIFVGEKLCGILLETDSDYSAMRALNYYSQSSNANNPYINGPTVMGEGKYRYATAKGWHGSYLQIHLKKVDFANDIFQDKYYIIIGAPHAVNGWIDEVLAHVPSQ